MSSVDSALATDSDQDDTCDHHASVANTSLVAPADEVSWHKHQPAWHCGAFKRGESLQQLLFMVTQQIINKAECAVSVCLV